MNRFYVGQRVRIVRAKKLKRFIGRTAVITARYFDPLAEPGDRHGWALSINHELPAPFNGAARWAPWQDWHLEPIYDGNEVVSWDACAWRPTERVA